MAADAADFHPSLHKKNGKGLHIPYILYDHFAENACELWKKKSRGCSGEEKARMSCCAYVASRG